jgi:hypothetical protein
MVPRCATLERSPEGTEPQCVTLKCRLNTLLILNQLSRVRTQIAANTTLLELTYPKTMAILLAITSSWFGSILLVQRRSKTAVRR